MKYVEPKLSAARFDPIFTSGNGTIPADALASGLGYDVSISYEELLLRAAKNAEDVIKYIE